MPAITNLEILLSELSPCLELGAYVFSTSESTQYGDLADTSPIACFAEAEGLTLVMKEEDAVSAGLAYEGTYRQITLRVHSSLAAVGLTAAVSTALAQHNISANMIAAYHHDHVFVPAKDAALAMKVLKELSRQSRPLTGPNEVD